MNDYWWIVAKYNVGRAIKEKKWRGRLSNIATCFNASRRVQPAASKEQDWDEQPRRFTHHPASRPRRSGVEAVSHQDSDGHQRQRPTQSAVGVSACQTGSL